MNKYIIVFALFFSANLPLHAMGTEELESREQRKQLINEHEQTRMTDLLAPYWSQSANIREELEWLEKNPKVHVDSSKARLARVQFEEAQKNYQSALKDTLGELKEHYRELLEWHDLNAQLSSGKPEGLIVDIAKLRKISERMKEIEAKNEVKGA